MEHITQHTQGHAIAIPESGAHHTTYTGTGQIPSGDSDDKKDCVYRAYLVQHDCYGEDSNLALVDF